MYNSDLEIDFSGIMIITRCMEGFNIASLEITKKKSLRRYQLYVAGNKVYSVDSYKVIMHYI